MQNNHNTKITNAILAAPNICSNDILYLLNLNKSSAAQIAALCNCSEGFVFRVIKGRSRSVKVANRIAEVINTSSNRLWPGAYCYSPKKPVKTVASA